MVLSIGEFLAYTQTLVSRIRLEGEASPALVPTGEG